VLHTSTLGLPSLLPHRYSPPSAPALLLPRSPTAPRTTEPMLVESRDPVPVRSRAQVWGGATATPWYTHLNPLLLLPLYSCYCCCLCCYLSCYHSMVSHGILHFFFWTLAAAKYHMQSHLFLSSCCCQVFQTTPLDFLYCCCRAGLLVWPYWSLGGTSPGLACKYCSQPATVRQECVTVSQGPRLRVASLCQFACNYPQSTQSTYRAYTVHAHSKHSMQGLHTSYTHYTQNTDFSHYIHTVHTKITGNTQCRHTVVHASAEPFFFFFFFFSLFACAGTTRTLQAPLSLRRQSHRRRLREPVQSAGPLQQGKKVHRHLYSPFQTK